MELVIVRHADAEPDSGEGDSARRLTPRGERQAQTLASALERVGVRLSAVLTSPFVRTVATAEPLTRLLPPGVRVSTAPELASGRLDPANVSRLVRGMGVGCVAVVGHMPDVGVFAGWLLGAPPIDFEKGAAMLVRFESGVAPGEGQMVWFAPPAWHGVMQ